MSSPRNVLPSEAIEPFLLRAPVDVHGMARALNISVTSSVLPDGVSGKISRTADGSYGITVNASHSETRKRFTVAHQIAHFVLHRDLIGDGVVDDDTYRSDQPEHVEFQASRYAASLLMPIDLMRKAFADGPATDRELAESFDVSPAVAALRAIELRLPVEKFDQSASPQP